jgi:NodT family efflux transporter outer membrane factor (OMF) lipoprotein
MGSEINDTRMNRLVVILGLAALLTAGCAMVGPDYARPPVKVEKSWQEPANKQMQSAQVNYKDWWQVFKDPVLNQLIDTAYRENLPLRIAGVRVLEARAQLGIAVGEFYPQTQQGTGLYQRERVSERAAEAVYSNIYTFSQDQIGLTASWELDFWGKFRRSIQSADAGLHASIADYDNVLVSLTGDVAANYVNIRTIEKRLVIAHENVKIQTESLQIAKARFLGGTTSERDVQQAKTELASTQSTIPTLESQLRQSQNALCVLLGKPPQHLAELMQGAAHIPAPPPQVAVGIPADLLRRRPDIRFAEMQAMAQCSRIGVAKADLFPAFSLTGAIGLAASDVAHFFLGDMFQWRSRTGAFGPSFHWNILNYGQITNQVRVQDARFQELLIAYQNTVLKAQQEVEDNLIAFIKSQERAKYLVASTAAAKRSLDLAIIQYREGITDFTTVLTAQQALLAQQNALAVTLGDISRNLVGLYRALGGGWQIRGGRDFVPPKIKEAMARRTNWGRLLTPVAVRPVAESQRHLLRAPEW